MYTALIKLPNGSKPKDLSDFHLTTIVGCAASISLIALIILNVFPAKVHPPGGPLLQSAAIIGSILLILSCLFIMGKRFGRNGKNGFKGHVWLASIGAILVIVHSGFSILSIPGILLILLLVITLLGLWGRLILSQKMMNTFGSKLAAFSTTNETKKTELARIIQHKRELLKEIDPTADEAIFSIQAKNWIKTPLLCYQYQQTVEKENHLLETRKSVSFGQAYYRSLHRLLSIAFLFGLLLHVITTTFFAGYVADGRSIYWWHITEWGS